MSGYTRFGAEGPAGRMLFGTRSNVLSAWPTQGDATTQQVDAVKMIQRQWRLRAHILERYAPYFFSQRSQEPASFGTIRFKGNTHRSVRRNQAEWVRLSSEEFHARSPRVLLLLERFWKLKTCAPRCRQPCGVFPLLFHASAQLNDTHPLELRCTSRAPSGLR